MAVMTDVTNFISPLDRLPKPHLRVLVQTRGNGRTHELVGYVSIYDYKWHRDSNCSKITSRVIGWRPL